MSDYVNVEGRSDLIRDTHSRALINIDDSAYSAVLKKKQLSFQKDLEIKTLKNDVCELKDLVQQLIIKLEDNNGKTKI